MYSNLSPNGSLKLYHFIAIMTAIMVVLSQIPTFHSLRHINFASLLLSLGYTFLVVGACINAGMLIALYLTLIMYLDICQYVTTKFIRGVSESFEIEGAYVNLMNVKVDPIIWKIHSLTRKWRVVFKSAYVMLSCTRPGIFIIAFSM